MVGNQLLNTLKTIGVVARADINAALLPTLTRLAHNEAPEVSI